jgi:anti-sigma-K factor RskA
VNVPSTHPRDGDPELDSLLGAYALDALDPAERDRVEQYLAAHPTARDEVDELRESAASLALAPVHDLTAPSELWDRISEKIGEEPRAFTPLPKKSRRRPALIGSALAAVAAIAIVFLAASLLVVRDNDSRPTDLQAAYDKAAEQSGAREVALASATGDAVAHAVVLPDGTGYLRNDDMTPLSAGETYQLWAVSGAPDAPVVISAGVFGTDPDTVAFHTSPDVHTLGLTVEQAPGVVSSTQPMYAQAALT